jgi:signal transduction histidine kinase
VESANTILACAAHQKRIIDDVLSLSRLESDMLSFTPVARSPSDVIELTLRMFSGEFKASGTLIEAVRQQSYDDLAIDHTLIDPSRLVSRTKRSGGRHQP